MTKRNIFLLILAWIVWRLGLFGVGYVADYVLKYDPSFPYAFSVLIVYDIPRWFYSWAGFDGVHYLTIANRGYMGTSLIQAFFPAYPFSFRMLGFLSNTIYQGLLISNIASIAALILWFWWVSLQSNTKVAWLATGLWLCFPMSFFLGAIYSESLFLTLVLGVFIAAHYRMWLLSLVLIGIATGTRIVGVFLIPWVLLEYWQTQAKISTAFFADWKTTVLGIWKKKVWQNPLSYWPVFGVVGLVLYMVYLQLYFNDPLFFLHVQAEFGAGRQESIVLLPQVMWRYVKILITYRPIGLKYFALVQELTFSMVTLAALIASIQKIKLNTWLFMAGGFILPTLTGTFSSMPRYVMVCFPLLFWLALYLEKKPWRYAAVICVSSLLLIINTILFIQGYWVA